MSSEQKFQPYFIYGLCDPRTARIRYVGVTIHPDQRLREHLSKWSLKKRSRKNGWLKSLLKLDLRPTMPWLEIADHWDEACEIEQFWIEKLLNQGFDLTNLTKGGDGIYGYQHSEETKKKIGAANKGLPRSQELRDRISRTKMGRKMPPRRADWGANLSEALKGHRMPDSVRQKLLLANTGRKQSDATKEKRRLTWQKKWLENSKFTIRDILAIRFAYPEKTYKELAALYQVSMPTIARIVKGEVCPEITIS